MRYRTLLGLLASSSLIFNSFSEPIEKETSMEIINRNVKSNIEKKEILTEITQYLDKKDTKGEDLFSHVIRTQSEDKKSGKIYGIMYNVDQNNNIYQTPNVICYIDYFKRKSNEDKNGEYHFKLQMYWDCGKEKIEKYKDLPNIFDYKPDGKVDYEVYQEFNYDLNNLKVFVLPKIKNKPKTILG